MEFDESGIGRGCSCSDLCFFSLFSLYLDWRWLAHAVVWDTLNGWMRPYDINLDRICYWVSGAGSIRPITAASNEIMVLHNACHTRRNKRRKKRYFTAPVVQQWLCDSISFSLNMQVLRKNSDFLLINRKFESFFLQFSLLNAII